MESRGFIFLTYDNEYNTEDSNLDKAQGLDEAICGRKANNEDS
jgi:hypothetical protein